MAVTSFNSEVALRTQVVSEILETPELIQKYERKGGKASDLKVIKQAGLDAEAASLGQSQARYAWKGTIQEAKGALAAVKKESLAIRDVLHVVHISLAQANAPAALLAKIEGLIRNEGERVSSVTEVGGIKTRKRRKSTSQEAQRAEIARDAVALLSFTEIHEELAARRVDVARLEALHQAATALSGAFMKRFAWRGAQKNATQAERAAVARQRAHWGATYRLLRGLAREDERVHSLLSAAAR